MGFSVISVVPWADRMRAAVISASGALFLRPYSMREWARWICWTAVASSDDLALAASSGGAWFVSFFSWAVNGRATSSNGALTRTGVA
jgi:hypothetical protein